MHRILKNRIFAGILIAVIITAILSIGILTNTFQNLHNTLSDSLYTLNGPSEDIIIIKVDDQSTQPMPEGLGRFAQWTRENFTNTLQQLKTENPSIIAFDFVFHTETTQIPKETLNKIKGTINDLPTNSEKLDQYQDFFDQYSSTINDPIDDEFAEEIQSFDNIVLAALAEGDSLIAPLLKFSINAELGIANEYADKDGVIRRSTPYHQVGDQIYDDFAVATVKKYLQTDELDLPLENNRMMVNFFGEPYSFESISFVDVVNGNFLPGTFANKIVLIGPTSSKEFHDEHLTPRSNTTPMPGVEFRANEIQTILDGKFLSNQSKFSQIITIVLLTAALTIILNYLGIILSIILAFTALIGYYLAAHGFYRKGLIVNMVYPFIAIMLAYLGSWIYQYFIADKNKREMKAAFSHYVSDKLVDEIVKNPDMVKLGGEKRIVTVFFSDIKDSTRISENTEISTWVAQINEYFTVMESVIKKHGGTLDKYEGDAIMCFWNAPILQENHEVLAYKCALEMQRTLKLLNEKWKSQGKVELEVRIGINTGEAIVGNFGSANRFDYTVMGDTVNTTSRLESPANKTYGTTVIAAGIGNGVEEVIMRELDTVILPGKHDPVVLYELVCLKEETSPEVQDFVKTYSAGLQAYKKQDWTAAISHFKNLLKKFPKDSVSEIMVQRCKVLNEGGKIQELDENMVYRIVNK
jgi:adenylate cyclase